MPREEVTLGIQPERRFIVNHENSTFIPLTDLIKARKFDRVSHDITDEQFPTPDRLWNDYKEFHFGEIISSDGAVEQIQQEGYEPANSHELLLWDGWNGKDVVIALGSVADIHGNRPVLYLYKNWHLRRNLYVGWWNGVWSTSCHFLGVRKPSDI